MQHIKNTLIILFIATIFFSCRRTRVRNYPSNVSSTVKITDTTKADSMTIIRGLLQTEYDSVVTALKLLPEYKNAIWLTPKQTQEYLASAERNQKKFSFRENYLQEYPENWIREDDTTEVQYSRSFYCYINFDTAQSVLPLVEVFKIFDDATKDSRTKVTSSNSTAIKTKFFYIPKKKIGYLESSLRSDATDNELIYDKEFPIDFDEDIRKDFRVK